MVSLTGLITTMNYFSTSQAAGRYAKGRPDFHHNSIAHIKAMLKPEQMLPRALDVACGTGLSTKALLEIAEEVHGTDSSAAMLDHALCKDHIHYQMAPAEQLPFPDAHFDLITVCSGVHWFRIDAFLEEAARVLISRGWLVLYENHFIADMEGYPSFTPWFRERYLKKFPSPPRHNDYPWQNDHLLPKGWSLLTKEVFTNPVVFSKAALIRYFCTQSNIISATESGELTYADAEDWLNQELDPFFKEKDAERLIHYGNWIMYLQKQA